MQSNDKNTNTSENDETPADPDKAVGETESDIITIRNFIGGGESLTTPGGDLTQDADEADAERRRDAETPRRRDGGT